MTDEKEVLPVDPETPEDEHADDEIEDELDEGEGNEPQPNETVEQVKARLAVSEDARKRLFARLQREKNKPAPVAAAPAPKKAETPTGLTRDEAILFAKGFDEGEVEYANKIAELEGVSVTAATNTDLFKTWKSNKDADAKKLQAQLGTSKGARTTTKKTFDTPGLSDEDHKALFKETVG